MPFTLAHPAAILPLRRLRFLQTVPLVIGSLVPDLPYFFPSRFGRTYFPDTHTLYGSFSVDLPLGMAVLLLLLLLREPLTVMLGARLRWVCRQSIDNFYARPLHWPIALLSILVGTWTHMIWDSFTHESTWTTARVAALSAPVSVFGWDTETSHLLQYVSSVFGLAVLAVWLGLRVLRAPRSVVEDPTLPRARWLTLALISVVALAFGLSRVLAAWNTGATYYHLAYLLTTRSISLFATAYLAAGILTVFSRRPVPEPAQ